MCVSETCFSKKYHIVFTTLPAFVHPLSLRPLDTGLPSCRYCSPKRLRAALTVENDVLTRTPWDLGFTAPRHADSGCSSGNAIASRTPSIFHHLATLRCSAHATCAASDFLPGCLHALKVNPAPRFKSVHLVLLGSASHC